MLLSYKELVELTTMNPPVITNGSRALINGSSIDVTLGERILMEAANPAVAEDECSVVSLRNGDAIYTEEHILEGDEPFLLLPGQCILAHTEQSFNLPLDISAEYKLKSSMARIFLEHLTAGWCDPGWQGSVLTLELRNMNQHHAIELRRGDRIGQMTFMRHTPVPEERSYAGRGRYNHDFSVSPSKPPIDDKPPSGGRRRK